MSGTNGWRMALSVVALAVGVALSRQASALDLYFDNDGTTTTNISGRGTWDTTSSLWRAGSSTGTLQTWDNTGTANAYFGIGTGTASLGGTVTLNGTINAASVIVNGSSGKGATTINGGTLKLFGNGPNMYCGVYTGTLTINSVIADNNNVGLQYRQGPTFVTGQGNTGTVVLTAANTYTGPTSVGCNGVLTLDYTQGTSSNIVNSASSLVVGNGGQLKINTGAGSGLIQTFNGTTFATGSSTVSFNATAANTKTVALGALSRQVGSAGNIYTYSANGGYFTTTSDNADYRPVGGSKTILPGGILFNSPSQYSPTDFPSVDSSHRIVKVPTYSTGFVAGADVNAQINTSTPAAMTINSLRFNSAGSYTVNTQGDLVIASGGMLMTAGVGSGNSVTINNNHLTSANGFLNPWGAGDLIIYNNVTPSATNNLPTNITMTINSQITDCGSTSVGITKAGTGNLLLSGNNSYTGPTYLLNNCSTTGGIVVTSNNALGTADCGTYFTNGYNPGGDGNGGFLQFRGVNYTTPEPVTLLYPGGGARLPWIRADGGASTFAGPISSPYGGMAVGVVPGSSLALTGNIATASGSTLSINNYDLATFPTWSGTVTLGGNNASISGPVTLYGGTLIAANGNAFGGSGNAVTIGSLGTSYAGLPTVSELQLQGGIALPQTSVTLYGNLRNNSGSNSIAGSPSWGGIWIGKSLQLTGGFYADCGSLILPGMTDSVPGSSTVLHPIAFGGTGGTGTFTGAVGGANYFNPVVSGGATWVFNAANTYKAATTVSGGSTLQIKNATGLGGLEVLQAGQTVGTTVSGSGTLDLYGITAQYPITLSGGSLINSNASTATTLSAATGIIGIVPTSGGSGYSAVPTISFGGGGGAAATAQLGLTATSLGTIGGGTKYQAGDVVYVTGGNGYAWITVDSVDANGAITGWHLSNPGAGFTGAPTTLATMHQGTAATLTGATATNFQVTQINVTTAGTNVAPTVSFSSGAAAATAYANAGVTLVGANNNIGGAGTFIVNPVITGNGGFTKIGSDNLTLKAVNTYTGPTGIAGGLLTLGRNYAVPSTSAVTLTGGALAMNGYTDCVTSLALAGGNVTGLGTLVVQGGKITGVGSISPVLKLLGGANLAPGNSPGSVTLGRASFGSSADNYTVDINGLGVANYDNVLYKVAMTLNSATLVINDLNYAASAAINDRFFIMDSDNSAAGAAVAGTFNGLANGATVFGASGIGYTVNYNFAGDPRGTLNDVALTTLSLPAAPEPATLFLVGTGALGVVAFIRRQRMK